MVQTMAFKRGAENKGNGKIKNTQPYNPKQQRQ